MSKSTKVQSNDALLNAALHPNTNEADQADNQTGTNEPSLFTAKEAKLKNQILRVVKTSKKLSAKQVQILFPSQKADYITDIMKRMKDAGLVNLYIAYEDLMKPDADIIAEPV